MKSPKVILFFLLLLTEIVPLFSQTNSKSNSGMKKVSVTVNDSVVYFEIPEGAHLVDRNKNLFFLDGKRVKDFEEFDRTDKTHVMGALSRNAIFHFGEMARNGIIIFES